MESRDLTKLLDRLQLSDSGAIFYYSKENWYSFVTVETKSRLDIIQPSAFYIFNSQPYILFFDISGPLFNKERENQIHKQVWSFDQSPIIFIIKDNDIQIFNAFAYEKKLNRLQKINVSNEDIDKQFSFWNLQSGKVWEWMKDAFYQKNQIRNKRVSQKLFENIKDVKEKLTDVINNNALSESEANTLILRLIFIRYLIDRNVKLDVQFVSGNTINESRFSFNSLIEDPKKLNGFFGILNNKFNGVLFKGTNFELSKAQAKDLSAVFNGEVPKEGSLFFGLDFFFEIFDFSIIPVEMISGIYESLINLETRKLHSAVYTPSFLVEYILTGTIDKFFVKDENKAIAECKVFDPSVGSGIFLVQSFRRMVDRELIKTKRISKTRLREIAENNLFGIDINEQALKVTCFSIYIAMLDYIDPKSIVTTFHFPELINKNLFEADFFNLQHEFNKKITEVRPDFILGNPPWKRDNTKMHLDWLNGANYFSKKITGKIEIAQSFLLRTRDFMFPNTVSSLIATSTIFFNITSTTKEFKQHFFKIFCISEFFDLSAVKQSLFENQESPASIVFYSLSGNKNFRENTIRHISLKINIFLTYFKTLVIEKFDQKSIPQKHFLDNEWMFKVALYGNSLDFRFIKRLENVETTIDNVIDGKNIFKGAGIKRGAKPKPYPELIGFPIIESEGIKEYYTKIDPTKKLKTEDVLLSRGRKAEIFKGKKILLKEQCKDWNTPVISYIEDDCVFRNGTFSISSVNESAIKLLYGYFITDFYLYYIFITSCAWGIGTRPAIRFDEEFLSFPFLKSRPDQENQIIQLVNEFLVPFQEHYFNDFILGYPIKNNDLLLKINQIIQEIYEIKNYEIDLINYVLDVSRFQFQESKQKAITRKIHTDKAFIEKYVDVYLSEFKNLYENEYLRVDIYALDYFIAINFVFSEEEPLKQINFIDDVTDETKVFGILASEISIVEKSKDLFLQKNIHGFEDNSFYIIKPNEFKCWHRAIAWYDVADIKESIEVAEIDYLTHESNV